jgi:polar amino acid transport system substrate-binding protein
VSIGFFCAATLAQAPTITAVSEHWPPFQIVENQKVIDGLSYDITKAALTAANLKAEIHGYAWARSYKMAQNHPNVLIFAIARNEKREKLFKWVGEIITVDNSLWHLEHRKDIKVKNLEDAKNYRIAVPRSDVRHQYLLDNGFSAPKNIDVVASYQHTLNMLYRGRTDMVVANKMVLADLINNMSLDATLIREVPNINIHLGKLFIAFSLQTDDKLVKQLSLGLRTIKSNGTYNKLIDKWYAKLGKLGEDLEHPSIHVAPPINHQ